MARDLKALLAAVDAAGYALAPPQDDTSVAAGFHPEQAFRNGHWVAAHAERLALPDPMGRQHAPVVPEPLAWLYDVVTGLRPRREAF